MLTRWPFYCTKDGGWLSGEPTLWLEGWNFQSCSRSLGKGEGLEVNQSPMANNLIDRSCGMKPP